jgi:hypothetical protein
VSEPLDAADERRAPDDRPQQRSPAWSGAVAVALVAASSAVVLGLYLSPYVSGRLSTPIGGDTPWYVARQELVQAEGLDAVVGLGSSGIPLKPLADRPGYPVLGSLLTAATGVHAFELVFVLPAVVALVTGLAAGAVGVGALSEPRWAAAVYTAIVGGSVFIARTAVMSYDNLIVDALLLAIVVCILLVCDGRGGVAAAALLVGAAALTHWRFLATFMALPLSLLAVLAIDAIVRARRGQPLRTSPAVRLAVLIGASILAAAAALAIVPSRSFVLPKVQLKRIALETSQWMPGFRLAITGPAAAAGALALWWPPDRRRRWAIVVLGLWAASVPAAWFLSHSLGRNVPIYRVTAFALGIPVLAAAALVGVARLLGWRWPIAGAALACAIVLAGAAVWIRLSDDLWSSQVPVVGPEDVRELGIVGTYLRTEGSARPVVFVVERGTGTQPKRALRALLPPRVAADAGVYIGTPENALAGRVTTFETGKQNRKAIQAFKQVRPLLERDPIILRPAAFAGGNPPRGDWPSIGEGVSLVRGPPPPRPIAAPSVSARPASTIVANALAVLLVLLVVGSGWSSALVPLGSFERALLAPSFGVAGSVVAGVAAGRLGVVPSGGAGIAILAAVTTGGWLVWAALLAFRRRSPRAGRPGSAAEHVEAPVRESEPAG